MMGKPEVSIILLTYNPQKEKLFCTLKSIVKQTGCSYEIIVSDDGSETTYEDDVKDYLKRESQADFQYLKSENNVGTIKNYLKALNRARGKYSYGISPGDLFHDEHVIRDLFLFCEEKNADICFGDADYYSIQDHSITLYDGLVRSPVHPSLFENRNIKKQKTAFLFGNNILGATYFRKTDIAEKYIGEASGFLTYIEDMSSTLFALGDGVTLTHYPREVIWYDYRAGISSSTERKWREILQNEYDTIQQMIKLKYADDPVMDAAYRYLTAANKVIGMLETCLFHPYISCIVLRQKITPRKSINNEARQKEALSSDYMKDILGDIHYASC